MKRSFQYTIVSAVTLVIVVLFACGKGGEESYGGGSGGGGNPPPANSCGSVSAKFATDVSPIIAASCATGSGCHGSGSTHGPGALTTYTQIHSAAAQIKSSVVNKTMPKGSSLSTDQIQKISCWVDNGALNN